MQKKLIALAVAGMASTAAFAQSNVTIYGLLQPSYDIIDGGGDKNSIDLNNNNSRIGFKGEEALGNGLKAIFQIESGVSIGQSRGEDSQGGILGGRDTFAGLAGGFGSITFGRHQSAYKKAADWADPFADTIADYNNIMGVYGGNYTLGSDADFNTRHNRSAYYTSPNWSGFQLVASYALNDEARDYSKATQADSSLSLAGTYQWGGLNLLAGYQTNGVAGTSEELDAWKLGAGYKFSFGTKLNAIWEQLSQDKYDNSRIYISGTHPITSNIDINAAYIKADGARLLGGEATNYSLGLDYKFSKRTSVQGIYTHLKNKDNGSFGLDAGYAAAAGEDKVSGFSVRLRHAF